MILSERVSSGRPLWGIVVAVALGMSAWPAWSLAQPRNSEKQGPSKEDGTAKEVTVTISARVADHEGQPIAGAKVWWVSNHRLRVNRIETATTDEEGRFIVSPPKDHQYPWGRLWVYKEDKQVATAAVGFRPEESVLKIASVKRSIEGLDRLGIYYHESTDAVIILDPATDIDFRIVAPDGSPAVGVAVEPSNYMASPTHSERFPDPLLAILTTTTNSEGRVHFTNLSRWWLGSVLIRSDKLGMQDFYFHRGKWDDLSVEKTIQLRSTGRVEGRLEAEDPQWTRGATVTVNGVSATTDAQGRFNVPATVAGRLSIHCSLAEDAPVLPELPKNLTLPANETLSVTIHLRSPVIVRGVVRTEDTGEPVAGVEINVQDEYRSSFPHVISDSDGRYEARILPGEVFTQVISMPKGPPYFRQADGTWNRTTKIAADASMVELPPILLTPLVPLAGKVIDQDDKPVPFVEVNCLLERQGNKQRKSLGRGVQTNEQGEFRALIPKGVDAEVFSIRSGNGFGERDANIVQVDPYILRIKTAGAR